MKMVARLPEGVPEEFRKKVSRRLSSSQVGTLCLVLNSESFTDLDKLNFLMFVWFWAQANFYYTAPDAKK